MRVLAEFIMRGRTQACATALLGTFFPVISPATVGLVTLCKGSREGLIVLLWAILPLLVTLYLSAESLLLNAISVVSLSMLVVSANLLRWTASWQSTVLGSQIVAAVAAIGFALSWDAAGGQMIDEIGALLTNMLPQQGAAAQETVMVERTTVLGLMALVLAANAVVSLMVSRWWQALLYNPGGFQKEFHSYRVDSRIAMILLVALISGLSLPSEYRFWAELMVLPLLLSGLALVHHSVRFLQLAGHWLVLMYLGLMFFGPVLVVLGFTDSLVNLRSRLAAMKNRQ